MDEGKKTAILAIVTKKAEYIQGGGVPVFVVNDHQAVQMTGRRLEKIMDASAHELDENTIIIVSH